MTHFNMKLLAPAPADIFAGSFFTGAGLKLAQRICNSADHWYLRQAVPTSTACLAKGM